VVKEEPKPKQDMKPREETKPPEKPKPKGEYIIAENYTPQERKKQQVMIEAREKTIVTDKIEEKEQKKTTLVKRSERLKEGVEIFETPKKR
jgi:hypothetical protein